MLKLIDPDNICLQYQQMCYNFNMTIREILKNDKLIWQDIAQSAVIFISEQAKTEEIVPLLLETIPE